MTIERRLDRHIGRHPIRGMLSPAVRHRPRGDGVLVGEVPAAVIP
jgi:hypothetical protein